MFFLSIPQAWHLVGTWSEQLPSESNLIGMGQTELIMTLHSIFIPLLLVISYYLFNRNNKNESKKIIHKFILLRRVLNSFLPIIFSAA